MPSPSHPPTPMLQGVTPPRSGSRAGPEAAKLCHSSLPPCSPSPKPVLSLHHLLDVSPVSGLPTMKASGRSLGGGRILGTGRSLSPAVPPPSQATPPPQHKRNASLLSPAPSESSRSEQGSADSSATTIEAQDLTSRVSLGREEPITGGQAAAAAAATSRLVCPICNDEMVTLLQLNR